MANISLDYLSFSIPLTNKIDELHVAMQVIPQAFREMFGNVIYEELMLKPDGWNGASGRRPYRFGYQNNLIGVFIHFGGHDNALVQFSGQGCKWLAMNNFDEKVLFCAMDRITRLDIAIDIETETTPSAFIEAGYNNRIKSSSIQKSPTGETCYIGSRTSEKFCRVYRYNEPHPRHKLLRVEYETKRAQARIVAECILNDGLAHTSERLTKYYQWRSEVMPEPSEIVSAIPSEITTRSDAKTVHWLLKQCAPAFRRLVQNGTIENPEEMFREHFLPEEPIQRKIL